jgi:hypothetical protein
VKYGRENFDVAMDNEYTTNTTNYCHHTASKTATIRVKHLKK